MNKKYNIEFYALSDIGKISDRNDDRVCVAGTILRQEHLHQTTHFPTLMAVCDGVGGYEGGKDAAELVLQRIVEIPVGKITDSVELKTQLMTVNRQLLENKPKGCKGMYTTIAGVVFSNERTLVFHMGDSRVYRLRGQYLAKMTVDHSVAQNMVDMGCFENVSQAKQNAGGEIYLCMGYDIADEPEISILPVSQEGDIYLVCTDGVWEGVTLEEIEGILLRNDDIATSAEELRTLVLAKDGSDNLTFCLGKVVAITETLEETC